MSQDEQKEEKIILTNEAEKLLKAFKEDKSVREEDLEKISISKTMKHVAFWYEKIRNAVDYQEDHLLRKNNIRRIIVRKFNIPIPSLEKISISLLKELVRAGYLDKTEYPQSTLDKIEEIVKKYQVLRKEILANWTKRELTNHLKILADIIACQLEELIMPHVKEEALVEAMTTFSKKRFLRSDNSKGEIKDIYIYIAVHKTLLKSDEATVRYQLFKKRYPGWFDIVEEKEITQSYQKFIEVNQEISQIINSLEAEKIQKILRRHSAAFIILLDIFRNNPQKIIEHISNQKIITLMIEDTCQNQYQKISQKIHRGVIQSIIYIFLTKMLLGVLLELPYDKITIGTIHYLPLAVNLLFPPVLMVLLTSRIKIPDWSNTEKIVAEIKKIIYQKDQDADNKEYLLKPLVKRSRTKNIFLTLLYILTFAISFGLIIWLLIYLQYNIVSGILFFLFLSIVSFFAFRLRKNAADLQLSEEKDNLLSAISDFFFMPFLRIGKWLAEKFAGINIFLIILDFIIEAPFKTIMEILEDWMIFIREKKEELT